MILKHREIREKLIKYKEGRNKKKKEKRKKILRNYFYHFIFYIKSYYMFTRYKNYVDVFIYAFGYIHSKQ